MMSSVDGRLIPGRFSEPFNGKSINDYGNYYFDLSKKFESDGILIGRNTLQEYFIPDLFKNNNDPATQNFQTHVAQKLGKNTTVVLDALGKTSYENKNGYDATIITILSEQVSDAYLQHLHNHQISYIFAGTDGQDLALAVAKLQEEFGIKHLLLEGGGIINGAFLKAGLISDLSLMIYPGIDGLKGSPSIFDYIGSENEIPSSGQTLEYISTEILQDGIVWINYKFHKK